MRLISHLLIAVLALAMTTESSGEELDRACRGDVVKLCEADPVSGSPVCRLLTQDKPETAESITAFLIALDDLSSSEKEKLICARLMGKKTIILSGVMHGSGIYFQLRGGSFGSAYFEQVSQEYQELDELYSRLYSLNVKLTETTDVVLVGVVRSIEYETSPPRLLRLRLIFASVDVIEITSESLGSQLTLKDAIEILKERVRERYQELVEVGQ